MSDSGQIHVTQSADDKRVLLCVLLLNVETNQLCVETMEGARQEEALAILDKYIKWRTPLRQQSGGGVDAR